MQNELCRLATFNNSMWKPAPGKPSSCILARIGFYHCQTRDAVICCFCQVTINSNEFGTEPELKHKQSSPTCPLACGNVTSDNVPLVDPVEVIKKFQGDPSVTDASDSPSSLTEITWNNHPSFRNIFQLLKTLSSLRGISHINEQDAIFIQIDLENPDFDRLRYEQVRLGTFANWLSTALVEPEALARAGLFYTGTSDRVQCAFCRNYLRSWVRGDLPDAEHRRHYPDCLFVRGCDVGNVPINNLSEISLPSSVRRLAISDTEQNQQQNVAARSLSTPLAPQSTVTQPQPPAAAATARSHSQNDSGTLATPQPTPASQHSSQPRASTSKAKHPAFASEASRVKSFEGKMIPRGQDVKVLAMAGFFHVGPHDNVKCFYCDGGLKNWQPTDDPWEEHAKWFPRCSFLMTQRDPGYIHMIQEVYRPDLMMQPNLPANIGSRGTPLGLPGNDIINEPEPPSVASAAGSTFRFTFEPREIKARMDSPSVKAVLSMGFPRELVRHAIQVKLSSTGDDFSSAQELVENVMQLQDLQDKGLLGPLLPPPSSTSSFSSPLPLTTLPSIHSSVSTVPVVSAPLPNIQPRQNPMSADLGSEEAAESAQSSAATSEQKPGDNTASKSVEGGAKSVKSKKRNKKRKPAKAAQGDTEAGEMDDEKETEMKQDMAASAFEGAAAAAAVGAGSDDADPEAKSLMEENRQLKEAKTCKVCMDEEVNVVFLPCGHLACCNNCAPALRNCPICRAFIRGTVRIFLS